MGLKKKPRKKYETPGHPWQGVRIEEERKILKNYGLKNKAEIWKMNSVLKGFKDQTKKLTARTDKQAEKEKKQLLEKVSKMGLLQKGTAIDSILELTVDDLLNRRLQSVIIARGLARSMKQSRQFITHGHISINGKKIDVPSYIVSLQEEPTISFLENSSFNNPEHPEREVEKKEEIKPKAKQVQKVDKTPEKKDEVKPPEAPTKEIKAPETTTQNVKR